MITGFNCTGCDGWKRGHRQVVWGFAANVKAIVSSGYSVDPVMADYEAYGFSGVVEKPYNLQKLGETLDEILK